jgi:hypothetical protein
VIPSFHSRSLGNHTDYFSENIMASSEMPNTFLNATRDNNAIRTIDLDLSICLDDILCKGITPTPEEAMQGEVDTILDIHVWINESRQHFISILDHLLSWRAPDMLPEQLFSRYPELRYCGWKVKKTWKIRGIRLATHVDSDVLFRTVIRTMINAGDQNEGRIIATMIPDLSSKRSKKHPHSPTVQVQAASLLKPTMHCSFVMEL